MFAFLIIIHNSMLAILSSPFSLTCLHLHAGVDYSFICVSHHNKNCLFIEINLITRRAIIKIFSLSFLSFSNSRPARGRCF